MNMCYSFEPLMGFCSHLCMLIVCKMQRPIIIFPFSKIVLFITYQVQQARQEYQASSGILKTALEIHTPKHILQHILLSSHLQKFQNE